jgi:mannose-6-phosphate isomerase-like protein (cupin superfamily)
LDTTPTGCFRVAPYFRISSGHRHEIQEEVYVLVSGGARAKVGDEILELKAWDAVRVSPEMVRQLEAGPEGAEIVVFGAPNTENRDAEMVPDWWSD